MNMPEHLNAIEKHITYITSVIIKELDFKKIRAVEALWNKEYHTVCLSFYINGEMTEEEREEIEIACVEIIAQCGDALLEENFIRWDYPKPLPEIKFAYQVSV